MSEHEHGHAEHGHEHSPGGGCCDHDHGHKESGGCCDHGHEESGGEHGHGHGHGHEEKNLTGDDICGDGGVLKTILVEGDATQGTPPPGSKVERPTQKFSVSVTSQPWSRRAVMAKCPGAS